MVAPSRQGVQVLAGTHGHGQVHGLAGGGDVVAQQLCRGRRRPDGAPGAVGMDLGLCLDAGTDAGSNLVAHDDGFQGGLARGANLFGHGDGPGRDVDGRVPAAQPAALVQFQGHAGGGVGQGGKDGLDSA